MLTDAELDAQLKELSAEKALRDEAKRRSEFSACLARKRILQAALVPCIDALAPEHRAGRYGDACTDRTLSGSTRRAHEPKDYGCTRCDLLAFTEISDDSKLAATDVHIRVVW